MCNPVSTDHPDRLLANGFHRGLKLEVVFNDGGFRCGYVRLPAGHPWHGRDTDQMDEVATVHGGVTFAEPDEHCGEEGPDDAWWVGFDCAHAYDAPDPELMDQLDLPPVVRKVYDELVRVPRRPPLRGPQHRLRGPGMPGAGRPGRDGHAGAGTQRRR